MSIRHNKKLLTRLVAVMALLLAFSAVPLKAGHYNEPFESESFSSFGGSKDGTFSVTYAGQGGGSCDSNDRRFRINVYYSYPGSDWKMYSNNSKYRSTPSNRPIYGHSLENSNAHICVGGSEFQFWLHGFNRWTTSGVEDNLYTWRR